MRAGAAAAKYAAGQEAGGSVIEVKTGNCADEICHLSFPSLLLLHRNGDVLPLDLVQQNPGNGDLLHLTRGHMLPLELAEDVFPVLHLDDHIPVDVVHAEEHLYRFLHVLPADVLGDGVSRRTS